jgi:hypothetical protein
MPSADAFMIRLACAALLAAASSGTAAEWVRVSDNDEYIAYADPATISREGDLARMSDLIDLKAPQMSPDGNPHASSLAHSQFDCVNPRMRTIAFSLYPGPMGDGDAVETRGESYRWYSVAPGTLLETLRQFACSSM